MSELRDLLDREAEITRPAADAFETTMRRFRRRRSLRRAGSAFVALAFFGTAVGFSALVLTRNHEPTRPPSSPGSVTPSDRPVLGETDIPPGFVDQLVISSSPQRLVVEAPEGQSRWIFNGNSCSVNQKWLHVTGGGGFGGAACDGDAYLALSVGGIGGNGALFSVASGRTLPIEGTRIRVTLQNGSSRLIDPLEGLWMVVIQRCGDYLDTEIRLIEALDGNSKVLSAKRTPAASPLPGRPGPWPPC